MKSYIYAIMRGKRTGVLAKAISLVLHAASYFYYAAIFLRRLLYKKRIFKPHKAGCRVISVGNITLGGTGKTPFALALAGLLKNNHKVAILTRGYGDDEWKMLKGVLGDIPLIVGSDRVKNAETARSLYGANTIILDDGFQHLRLYRDVNIVLIDATDPFGNRAIFPAGILREPLASLRDADLACLSKADMGRHNLKFIYETIMPYVKEENVLEGYHKPVCLVRASDNREEALGIVKGKRVCLVSSIANPDYFRFTVETIGAAPETEFAFLDHYDYKDVDIERVQNACDKKGIEFILTTEKDIPKLKNKLSAIRYPLYAVRVNFEITKGRKVLLEKCL